MVAKQDFSMELLTLDKVMPCLVRKGHAKADAFVQSFAGDYDVCYRCVVDADEDGIQTVVITWSLMEAKNWSSGEVEEAADWWASKNYELRSMEDLLIEMGVPSECVGNVPLYVLSNRYMVHGAGCIVSQEVIDTIQRQIGEFYMIPSSIHEVLLVPAKEWCDESEVNDLIKSVNAGFVNDDEILGECVKHWLQLKYNE